MNLLYPNSIEEYIIKILQKKSLSGAELLKTVQVHRPRTTKQALYAALRKLKEEEIVVMHHMRISLSSIWVVKMTEFFQLAKHFYTKDAVTDEGFLNLEDGDRISYTFKNPNITDIFWGHAFDILADIIPATEPIYIYNPHDWFMVARRESEKVLYDKLTSHNKKIYTLAGSTDAIDKLLKKEFDGINAQYHALDETVFEKRNYYLNIFGEYLIEAWLDETVTKRIDTFYKKYPEINEVTIKELQSIIAEEGKNKLTISRNATKAAKLKKLFTPYFF